MYRRPAIGFYWASNTIIARIRNPLVVVSKMEVEHCSNNNDSSSTCNEVPAPMTTWSQCELQNLRGAFELLDTENKGEISIDELRGALEELRTLHNNDANSTGVRNNIQSLLTSLQSFKSDAKLSLPDFVSLLTSPNPTYWKDDVEKVFGLFDANGKGYITMDDLRTVAHDLGERYVSDAEIHEMMQRVSSSGRVTLDQFREIMSNNTVLWWRFSKMRAMPVRVQLEVDGPVYRMILPL